MQKGNGRVNFKTIANLVVIFLLVTYDSFPGTIHSISIQTNKTTTRKMKQQDNGVNLVFENYSLLVSSACCGLPSSSRKQEKMILRCASMGLHWLRGNLLNLFKLRKNRTDWRQFLSLKSRNGDGLTLDKG